jgi:hypothetical protein
MTAMEMNPSTNIAPTTTPIINPMLTLFGLGVLLLAAADGRVVTVVVGLVLLVVVRPAPAVAVAG